MRLSGTKKYIHRPIIRIVTIIILISATVWLLAFSLSNSFYRNLVERYAGLESIVVRDRNGKEIFIDPNDRGFYARYIPTTPKNVSATFMRNEDRFFYYHTGVNPFSVIRSVISGN